MEQNRNKRKRWHPHPVKCLSCGTPFVPEGPFLRVCAACKESEEWLSGNCDFAVQEAANDNEPDPF